MRKLTLLFAALALAATCSVADAAKKGKKRVAAKPAAAQPVDPLAPAMRVTAGLMRDVSMIGRPQPAKKKGKKG